MSLSRKSFASRGLRRFTHSYRSVEDAFRVLTGAIRRLPDFLIIGAQKGGTSSLYSYLVKHPDVVSCFDKEPNYFFRYYDRGLNWYRSRFHLSIYDVLAERFQSRKLVTGESSVSYLASPAAAQRVYDLLPEIKLIVLLRNPVERAFSHYYYRRRKGNEPLSFEQVVAADKKKLEHGWKHLKQDGTRKTFGEMHFSYLPRGFYCDQLQTWMSVFPREQFLVLKSEDFFSDSRTVFKTVLEFLGLRDWDLPSYRKYNAGSYSSELSAATREELTAYFAPENRRLYRFLERDFGWEES